MATSTSITSIITSAMRESNLLPLGSTPTTAQIAEGVNLLSTIIAGVLGNEAGEPLTPFPLGSANIINPTGYPWWNNALPGNVYIPVNSRVMCNLTGKGTINLDPQPHDGARMGIVDVANNLATYNLTINGNGRNIEGASSQTYNTNGVIREWIYREDLGNWVIVSPIDANSLLPWPPEFDDMFTILLTMRLNPRYGQTVHPASAENLRATTQKFQARYTQSTVTAPAELGLIRLANYSRYYGRPGDGDPNGYFNAGQAY